MDAGRLKDRIVIQQKSITYDDLNAPVDSWSNFATVWSEFSPARGNEKLIAAQLREVQTFIVTIRHLDGLDTTMRIQFGGENYDIQNIETSVIRRKDFIKITCVQGQNNG